jgi:hypothetical protein
MGRVTLLAPNSAFNPTPSVIGKEDHGQVVGHTKTIAWATAGFLGLHGYLVLVRAHRRGRVQR